MFESVCVRVSAFERVCVRVRVFERVCVRVCLRVQMSEGLSMVSLPPSRLLKGLTDLARPHEIHERQ